MANLNVVDALELFNDFTKTYLKGSCCTEVYILSCKIQVETRPNRTQPSHASVQTVADNSSSEDEEGDAHFQAQDENSQLEAAAEGSSQQTHSRHHEYPEHKVTQMPRV